MSVREAYKTEFKKQNIAKVTMKYRVEKDSMGEVQVPEDALYGAQTTRAAMNFSFSERRLPARFLQRLALIKAAAASANRRIGVLPDDKAERIMASALQIADGAYLDQFPLDVFQTGSGTSTNMNMNEVIARLAGEDVHPNDDVNRSQSSNDVIPTCIQLSTALELEADLLPATERLAGVISARSEELRSVVKTGRTHLMDAMPITLGQELGAWAFQVDECGNRLHDLLPRLKALPLGGTAVGTGVNCPADFPAAAIATISSLTGFEFSAAENRFARMAGQDVAAECSACLRSLSVVLTKIANDLRWMSSGPQAGLAEIELRALQPGSSIMPGKVNPVIPEAVVMIGAEVMGNDVTVAQAAQSGNFQLNVMLPLIAEKLLTGIGLLARACDSLCGTVADFTVNEAHLSELLRRNPILVTALNSRIGYDKAAVIAKRAYAEQRDVIDVAEEETDIPRRELERLLDPAGLTRSGT